MSQNSQTIALAAAAIGPGILSGTSVGSTDPSDVVISDDTTLTPAMGPIGNASDAAAVVPNSGQISVYTVQPGDTVSSVAKMFGVSDATILASNNLKVGAKLKIGDTITILPISGLEYTVVSGDTLNSLAKKYSVDASDIAYYNDMSPDDSLTPGDTLIIPDDASDIASAPTTTTKKGPAKQPPTATGSKKGSSVSGIAFEYNPNKPDLGDYWTRPLPANVGHETQGLHGARHTAVDIGAPVGTPIYAAAAGTVLIADGRGLYNTGYGNYVVINHIINGQQIQTLYAHMNKVAATAGEKVTAGEIIGYVGRTGLATGPHLHFEVNGAVNPFADDPNYGASN